MSRTKRKPNTGGKSVDTSCGNNKGCPVCEGNRLHKHKKKEPIKDTTHIALCCGQNRIIT